MNYQYTLSSRKGHAMAKISVVKILLKAQSYEKKGEIAKAQKLYIKTLHKKLKIS